MAGKSIANDPPSGMDYKDGWLLRGDEEIDGLQYKKLFRRHFTSVHSNEIAWQILWGYLREDVANKKVFALQLSNLLGCNDNSSEYLLFDFSYVVGDTSQLCIHNDWVHAPAVLEEIYYDTLFGEERKLFRFQQILFHLIEGVGHMRGLMESTLMEESHYVFLYDYCRGTDEECGILVKVDEYPGSNYFSIYPNPASDLIYLHFGDIKNQCVIKIQDVFGRCFLKTYVEDGAVNLDISGVPEGMYFVSIADGNNLFSSKKLFILR